MVKSDGFIAPKYNRSQKDVVNLLSHSFCLVTILQNQLALLLLLLVMLVFDDLPPLLALLGGNFSRNSFLFDHDSNQ